MGRKRKISPEESEAQEAVAAVQVLDTAEFAGKSPTTSANLKTIPSKRKSRHATAALALFSDIEGADLPEINDPPVPVQCIEEPHEMETSAPTVFTITPQLSAELTKPNIEQPSTSAPVSKPPGLRGPKSVRDKIKSKTDIEIRPIYPDIRAGADFARDRTDLLGDQCQKVFECHLCRRVYFTLHSLKSHMRQQHVSGGRKIRCPHCKFVFMKLSGLRDHLSRGQCQKNIQEAEKRKQEGESVGEEGGDSNSASERPDKPKLNPHIAKKIFEPLIEKAMCIITPKNDTKPISRKRIEKSQLHKCDLCPCTYEQTDSLRRHYKQCHINLTPAQIRAKMKLLKPPSVVFKCTVADCQKVIPSKKLFKLHFKNAHPGIFNEMIERTMNNMGESVLYECPTCNKNYFLEDAYLKHRQECGDLEEDEGYEIEIDTDLLREPWIDPVEDEPKHSRRKNAVPQEEIPGADTAPDTQCRYCGKLFFTIYGRIDHERRHTRGEVTESKPDPATLNPPLLGDVEDSNESSHPDHEQRSEPIVQESPLIKVEGPIQIRCMDCNRMFHSFDALERHHQSAHVQKPTSVLRSQLA